MSVYNSSASVNFNSYIPCFIENGIIYQMDNYNKTPLGHTNESYAELEQTTQEYYNKLVEIGEIIPPKTQEEINNEMQQALKESQALNLKLLEMMENMKGDAKNDIKNNDRQNTTNVPESKPITSSKPSRTTDSGEKPK